MYDFTTMAFSLLNVVAAAENAKYYFLHAVAMDDQMERRRQLVESVEHDANKAIVDMRDRAAPLSALAMPAGVKDKPAANAGRQQSAVHDSVGRYNFKFPASSQINFMVSFQSLPPMIRQARAIDGVFD